MKQNGWGGGVDRLRAGLMPNAEGTMVASFQPVVVVGRFHRQDGKKERQNNKGNKREALFKEAHGWEALLGKAPG